MTKKKLEQVNKIFVMDFTWYPEDENYEGKRKDMIDWLNEIAKKAVWQIEECPSTKRLHFQGKFSLIERNWLKAVPNPLKMSFSITAKENKDDWSYVTKEATRIEGPWILQEVLDEPVMTIQLNNFMKEVLWWWQEQVMEFIQVYDDRKIDIIFDKHGNIGKSIFTEYCEYKGLIEEVPPLRNMEDIFQWVYGRPKKKAYFIDMPRGMKKDKLGDFYAGIEVIKNGVAYDKRYQAKKIRFDRPRIVVFTNTLPDFSLMSKDRWCVWRVSGWMEKGIIMNIELKDYNYESSEECEVESESED